MMTLPQTLDYLAFVVQLATNVAVASYVFPMWRRRRLGFFGVLGFSALLGVFTAVASRMLGYSAISQQEYYLLWSSTTFLYIVDLILYAIGIRLMVRHFRSGPASTSSSTRVDSNPTA